jgi:hypothetical protein
LKDELIKSNAAIRDQLKQEYAAALGATQQQLIAANQSQLKEYMRKLGERNESQQREGRPPFQRREYEFTSQERAALGERERDVLYTDYSVEKEKTNTRSLGMLEDGRSEELVPTLVTEIRLALEDTDPLEHTALRAQRVEEAARSLSDRESQLRNDRRELLTESNPILAGPFHGFGNNKKQQHEAQLRLPLATKRLNPLELSPASNKRPRVN